MTSGGNTPVLMQISNDKISLIAIIKWAWIALILALNENDIRYTQQNSSQIKQKYLISCKEPENIESKYLKGKT